MIVSIVPFSTVTSALSNPTGVSLKVNVTRAVSPILRAVSSRVMTSVGSMVSSTMTLKSSVVSFPSESVAVHVTIVVPKLKVSPVRLLQTIAGAAPLVTGAQKVSTLSVAEMVKKTGDDDCATTSTGSGEGSDNTGSSVSVMVTENVCVPRLLAVSVAVQVTVVVPRGKLSPDAGKQETVGLTGSTSVATGVG